MSAKKLTADPSSIKVISTDSDIRLEAETLTRLKEAYGDNRKFEQAVLAQTKIKAATLNELAKNIVAALDNTGVGYWKATLEVSLAFGIVGIKGSLELGSK